MRTDSEGRDVTDLPGLWSEDDRVAKTDIGGSAFPNPQIGEHGMSLLDWFAGQALAGITSLEGAYLSYTEGELAERAYARAKAMIAAKRRLEQ